MGAWEKVKWTRAGQILKTLGWPCDDVPDDLPVPDYFDMLRRAERLEEASEYLAQALPRWEAVAWSARVVRDTTGVAGPRTREADALKATLLWVQDPSEPRRRAALTAARAADCASAESLAAMAAFYSGGSIAPATCEALPSPRDAAGRFAAGAVRVAASRSGDMRRALSKALDQGERMAEGRSQEGSA